VKNFGLLPTLGEHHGWGDNGYFRIVRGVNNLAIEEYCVWATIQEDSINDLTERLGNLNMHTIASGSEHVNTNNRKSNVLKKDTDVYTGSLGGGLIAMRSDALSDDIGIKTSPLPSDYLHEDSFPSSFGWHNYYGKNLLNIARQSNEPDVMRPGHLQSLR